MGGADGASCCCADACDSHSGTDHPNPSDKCPQIQSSDDHWTPGPRVTVDRNLLPAVQWMMLPGAFEPESVRQGRAGWAVTYRPLIPPEAKNSLLAQGCALNT
jgi:hypothetical protein